MTDLTMGMDPDATGEENIIIQGFFWDLPGRKRCRSSNLFAIHGAGGPTGVSDPNIFDRDAVEAGVCRLNLDQARHIGHG